MHTSWDIIIASSDQTLLATLKDVFKRLQLEPICASTLSEFRGLLAKHAGALAFCDLTLPDGDYRDLMAAARSIDSGTRLVILMPRLHGDEFTEAHRIGAFHVIGAPYHPKEIEWVVIQAKRDDWKMKRGPTTKPDELAPRVETDSSVTARTGYLRRKFQGPRSVRPAGAKHPYRSRLRGRSLPLLLPRRPLQRLRLAR